MIETNDTETGNCVWGTQRRAMPPSEVTDKKKNDTGTGNCVWGTQRRAMPQSLSPEAWNWKSIRLPAVTGVGCFCFCDNFFLWYLGLVGCLGFRVSGLGLRVKGAEKCPRRHFRHSNVPPEADLPRHFGTYTYVFTYVYIYMYICIYIYIEHGGSLGTQTCLRRQIWHSDPKPATWCLSNLPTPCLHPN